MQGQQHQHHGAPRYTGMASPSKAQGLKYCIPKIGFPHSCCQQHLQGKKPSCVCPEPSSQQDSLFSWHLPDTSPSLKLGPVLSVFPKFSLSSFPASYRHKLGNLGRGKTPAIHHTLHTLSNPQVLNQSCSPSLTWKQTGRRVVLPPHSLSCLGTEQSPQH